MKVVTKQNLLLAISLNILSSCASTNYIGDHNTPTTKVDIYYAAKDVKHEYKVLGHIETGASGDQNYVKQRLIDRAKSVGADGIIILNITSTGGDNSNSIQNADAIKYIR